jgi:sialic acid synthase SpsE
MSTPYDYEAVDLLDELNVPAFKIGSGEITNLSFLEYVGSKKRPIILGTGASNMKEIADAVAAIQYSNNYDIILLQCITQYPTPIEYANIKAMVTLSKAFDCPVGYSDHSRGNIVALGAVALGACVIEKHFTDDNLRNGPDHPHSMNLRQMDSLVHDVRELEKALGSPIKQVEECEKETRIIQRRGIYAKVNIETGTKLTEDMINILRPASDIQLNQLNQIIGRKTKVDIYEGDEIKWVNLSQL